MKKVFVLSMVMILIFATCIFYSASIYAANINEPTLEEDNVNEINNGSNTRSINGGSEINGEIWYGIELDITETPIITYEIDYSNSKLLDYLKPGDIVYEGNAGVDIVDYVGHIALVVDVVQDTPTQQGYVLLVESMPNVPNPYTNEPRDLGVCYALMTPTRFTEKYVTIVRVNNATDTQIQGAINFAKTQVDADKGWMVKLWKDTDGDPDYWYCSELVWAAYFHQGILLEPNDSSIVIPHEILNSSAVSTIIQYNKTTTLTYDSNGHTYSCDGDTYTEPHELEYDSCYEKCKICEYKRLINPHNFSNYVEDSYVQHRAYCTCGDYELQMHQHNYEYIAVDDEDHNRYCICGHYITSAHDYETYNSCYEKCRTCEHIIQTQEHDYTYGYESMNTETHYAYCECGAGRVDGHTFYASGELDVCIYCKLEKNHVHQYTYISCMDGNTHRKICSCGISVIEPCFGVAAPDSATCCIKCGQTMNGGAIKPWSKEDETVPLDDENNDEEEIK